MRNERVAFGTAGSAQSASPSPHSTRATRSSAQSAAPTCEMCVRWSVTEKNGLIGVASTLNRVSISTQLPGKGPRAAQSASRRSSSREACPDRHNPRFQVPTCLAYHAHRHICEMTLLASRSVLIGAIGLGVPCDEYFMPPAVVHRRGVGWYESCGLQARIYLGWRHAARLSASARR